MQSTDEAAPPRPPWEVDVVWAGVLRFLTEHEALRTANISKCMHPAQLISVLSPETFHLLSTAPPDVARRFLYRLDRLTALHVVSRRSWSPGFAALAAHSALRLSSQLEELTLAFPDRLPPTFALPPPFLTPPLGGFASTRRVTGGPVVLRALDAAGIRFPATQDVRVVAGGSRLADAFGEEDEEGDELLPNDYGPGYWNAQFALPTIPLYPPLSAALPRLFPQATSLISDCTNLCPPLPQPGSVAAPGTPLSAMRRLAVVGTGQVVAQQVQTGRCDNLDILAIHVANAAHAPGTLTDALRSLLARRPRVHVHVCVGTALPPGSPFVSLAQDPLFHGRFLLDAPGLRLRGPLSHNLPAARLLLGDRAVGGLPWPPRSEAWQHGGVGKVLFFDIPLPPQPALLMIAGPPLDAPSPPLAELPCVGTLEVSVPLSNTWEALVLDLVLGQEQTALPNLVNSRVTFSASAHGAFSIALTLPPRQAGTPAPLSDSATTGDRLLRLLSQGRELLTCRLQSGASHPAMLRAVVSRCPSLAAAVSELSVSSVAELAGLEDVLQGVRRLELRALRSEQSHGLVDLVRRLGRLECVVLSQREQLGWPEVAVVVLFLSHRVQVRVDKGI